MHFALLATAVLGVFSSDVSGSSLITHVLHEKRGVSSSSWAKRERLQPEKRVPARIALSQRNLDYGHESLMEISDPTSTKYGQHWTPKEVAETFVPSQSTVEETIAWLVESGVSRDRIALSPNREYLSWDATADELESLFNTEYYVYQHSRLGDHAVGCDEYHVPSHLKEHIDFISPGVGLSTTQAKKKSKRNLQKRQSGACDPTPPGVLNLTLDNCWLSASPQCFNALYDIPKPTSCHPNNSFGIFEAAHSYVQSDMDLFFEKVTPEIPVGTVPNNVLLNGAQLSQTAESGGEEEADLDFQVAWPLLYPQNITMIEPNLTAAQSAFFYGAGANLSNQSALAYSLGFMLEDMLAAFDASFCTNSTGDACGTVEAPKVISISFGGNELDYSEPELKRICNQFLKLGLQGTTVLIDSEDGGMSDRYGICQGPEQNIFNPTAWDACPYLTSVGATMIQPYASTSDPEAAAVFIQSNLTSGGGFSNFFPAPWYQTSALSTYFYRNPSPYPTYDYNGSASSIGANGGRFNRHGRGFPDVAATGM